MEMTKEKRDMIITSLYEKYGKGEISVNQREQLIQKMNDKFYVEMVNIATENAKADEEIDNEEKSIESPLKEKFEMFKEAVDAKYENGEITEEFRDQLLEKAKDKFCSNEEESE